MFKYCCTRVCYSRRRPFRSVIVRSRSEKKNDENGRQGCGTVRSRFKMVEEEEGTNEECSRAGRKTFDTRTRINVHRRWKLIHNSWYDCVANNQRAGRGHAMHKTAAKRCIYLGYVNWRRVLVRALRKRGVNNIVTDIENLATEFAGNCREAGRNCSEITSSIKNRAGVDCSR